MRVAKGIEVETVKSPRLSSPLSAQYRKTDNFLAAADSDISKLNNGIEKHDRNAHVLETLRPGICAPSIRTSNDAQRKTPEPKALPEVTTITKPAITAIRDPFPTPDLLGSQIGTGGEISQHLRDYEICSDTLERQVRDLSKIHRSLNTLERYIKELQTARDLVKGKCEAQETNIKKTTSDQAAAKQRYEKEVRDEYLKSLDKALEETRRREQDKMNEKLRMLEHRGGSR